MSNAFVPRGLQDPTIDGSLADTERVLAGLLPEDEQAALFQEVRAVDPAAPPSSAPLPEHPCAGCKKVISERGSRYFQAVGQYWHPKCFECHKCFVMIDLRLDGCFCIRDGMPWCKKCDMWDTKLNGSKPGQMVMVDKSSGGGAYVGGAPAPVGYSAALPSSAPAAGAASAAPPVSAAAAKITPVVPNWKKQQQQQAGASSTPSPARAGAPAASSTAHTPAEAAGVRARVNEGKIKCSSCFKPIFGMGRQFENHWYHSECLQCAKCGEVISGDEVLVSPSGPLHRGCGITIDDLEKCGKCAKPLREYVTIEGRKLHQECALCDHCEGQLAGGYAVVKGRIMCAECATNPSIALLAKKSVPVAGAEKTAGIRFDHQSQTTRSAAPAPAAPVAAAAAAGGGDGGGAHKFCPECGNASGGSKFCPECGHDLRK